MSEEVRKLINKIKNFSHFINESIENYDIVYRGQPPNVKGMSQKSSIWVTYDYDFATEYGNVKKYKLPKNLNILDTGNYGEWENLVDEFSDYGDYEEYKYEPNDEFISFLKSKNYDGFKNGNNILIFDKSLLINV